jgi:hypothetical protein
MKKLSQFILASLLLFLSFSFAFAQTDDNLGNFDDVEIVEFEDGRTSAPGQEEITEEVETDLEQENTKEETLQNEIIVPQRSFWDILGAILIPCFFLILIYFILKSFKF